MKLLLKGSLTLFLIQFCFLSYGQTVTQQLSPEQIEDRLTYVYGADFLNQNQELIRAYGTVINDRIEYVTTPATAGEKYPLLSTVPLMTKLNPTIQGANFANFNVNEFNPLAYNIEYFSDKPLVYRIDNTNYIMVIKPIITE